MRPLGTAAELERRRRQAVERYAAGDSPTTIARILGVDRGSGHRWARLAAAAPDGLAAKPSYGPKPLLSDEQHPQQVEVGQGVAGGAPRSGGGGLPRLYARSEPRRVGLGLVEVWAAVEPGSVGHGGVAGLGHGHAVRVEKRSHDVEVVHQPRESPSATLTLWLYSGWTQYCVQQEESQARLVLSPSPSGERGVILGVPSPKGSLAQEGEQVDVEASDEPQQA